MAALGTALGFWLSGAPGGALWLALLLLATLAATAFGNIVNDIRDIDTDRISHPSRPLPSGALTPTHAWIAAAIAAVAGLASAAAVSPVHAAGTAVPIALLTLYAYRLKATALWGNILVSLLVAYPVVFGALLAPRFARVLIPAALAFLLNLSREIVKDIEDIDGDRAVGLRTTASLPPGRLRILLASLSAVYLVGVFLPVLLGQFGAVYAVVCLVGALPLHAAWGRFLLVSHWSNHAAAMSRLIKFEMLCGLCALALDQIATG